MKDFGAWFSQQGQKTASTTPAAVAIELPYHIREAGDDEYEAECCCCHEWRPIMVSLAEIGDLDNYEHYCGSGPSCCP